MLLYTTHNADVDVCQSIPHNAAVEYTLETKLI